MLLQYHVNNFRSIGHTIEFSMMPTEDISDTGSYFEIETKVGKVMRRGGVFGSNASGKTSFVKSLDFAKKFILHGRDSDFGTGINQFCGNIKES